MLRFISKLNDDLKDQLFILCSATSRYLATITTQLMLRNVVPNSFVTPEGRMSRLGGWPNRVSFIFLNFLGKNLTIGAPIKIYRRRRRVKFIGGGGVRRRRPRLKFTSCFYVMIYEPNEYICDNYFVVID